MAKKILHLTDLHLTKDAPLHQDPKDGKRSAGRTKRIFEHIVANPKTQPQDCLIVISGDLVDEYTPNNYQLAADNISALRAAHYTVVVCPGNHDYYRTDDRVIDTTLAPVFWDTFVLPMSAQPGTVFRTPTNTVSYPALMDVGDDLTFLILDSNTGAAGTKSKGDFGPEQIESLPALVASIPLNRKVVVVIHHDPIYVSLMLKLLFSLKNRSKTALKSALSAQRANLLLCGHTHDQAIYGAKDLKSWNLELAVNGGTSTAHERAETDRNDSPHRLFDFSNLSAPEDLSLPWD